MDGYKTTTALPGPRLDHKYREIYGDAARAVQGHLAVVQLCSFLKMTIDLPQSGRLSPVIGGSLPAGAIDELGEAPAEPLHC